MAERFMVDDAGTLIDILTRDTYDYVSDVCPVLNKLWSQTNRFAKHNSELEKENEQLKKELHLMHMRTMFSTVKSFKGDVSKRYKYSEETDTVYDTANHYGQYDKILDKKEIVMLLNEYETLLKGDAE